MTPEQWTRAERLYHEAAAIAVVDRAAWLARACGGDDVVRREVESLLAQDVSRTGALDGHALDQVTLEVPAESLVGRHLGGYEFRALIDEGGMGQVYRARDLTLPRDVAVKVVSPEFTHDAVRRARFRKEAEILAGFAHPHIAHIYSFVEADDRFLLAMELVPGETLAERIARGPLRVSEALDIARQVAEALDAAHQKGVIHRDLKPANIRITPDSVVKVLDFGLATAARPASTGDRTSAMQTAPGTVLGTVAYMSPEQAAGESVDKRTDIWAFGCVLFEMLTGKRLFGGASATETLALVMRQEIDWSLLPTGLPTTLRALLRRCLERDPRKRLGDVAAIRFALDEIVGQDEQTAAATSADPGPPRGIVRTVVMSAALTAAVLVVAAVIGLAIWKPGTSPAPVRPRAFSLYLTQGQRLAGLTTLKPIVAISPADNYIAYVATTSGESARQIFLHSLESNLAEPVPGTVGGHTPFFSPDEGWLGFYNGQGMLSKIQIPVTGGVAEPLTPVVNPSGAAWTRDHQIILTFQGSALQRLPDTGGHSEPLTHLNPGETMHLWPQVFPDGQRLLFNVQSTTSTIAVQQFGTDDRHDLVQGPGISTPYFSNSGHVVYAQTGNLKAIPFDPRRETTERTAPAIVMSGVLQYGVGVAHYSVSSRGSIIYVPGGAKNNVYKLVRVNRNTGNVDHVFGASERLYAYPRISMDGHRVAVDVLDGTPPIWELWLYDVTADEPIPLTYRTDRDNRHATWIAPDRLIFQSDRTGTRQLFTLPTNGRAAEQVTNFPPGRSADLDVYSYPLSFCRDGLLTYVRIVNGAETWVQRQGSLAGQNGAAPERLDFHIVADGAAQLSPDCQRVAYVSDETGRREVWVRDYPSLGNRHQVSTSGGNEPVWNPDVNAQELFYRNGDDMLAVKLTAQGLPIGKADTLFTGLYAKAAGGYARPNYDVFPDGSFLMLKPVEPEQPLTQINVVLNWSEQLKRLGVTK